MSSDNDESKLKSCNVCGKQFKYLSDLKRHLRVHTGDRPFQCKICGKSFADKSKLKTHNHTHTGEKPYACQKCDKSFSCGSNLKKHDRTHTGEKPYTCKICGKSFSQMGDLNNHNRTHTGEKPYTCKICGKSFSHRGDLKKHDRKHTGEKPYICKICDKSFSSISSFKIHKCTDRVGLDQCGTYRPILPLFKIHIHKCTDENPYADDSSGKSCVEMEDSGKFDDACNSEKPNVCDVSFQSKNSLNELHSHTDNTLRNSFLSKGYFSEEVQKHIREVEEYIEEEANYFNNS